MIGVHDLQISYGLDIMILHSQKILILYDLRSIHVLEVYTCLEIYFSIYQDLSNYVVRLPIYFDLSNFHPVTEASSDGSLSTIS